MVNILFVDAWILNGVQVYQINISKMIPWNDVSLFKLIFLPFL